uniref:Uncharacterized protein n=1 Tax=Aegilops tauschii subsp. strangulata TaxID=200361 RepID=A0A453MW08_AEGTS
MRSNNRDARWVTPPEALWRIYGFELSKNSPPMLQLQLHLPNMHIVSFRKDQDIEQVVNREGVEKSMLTEYFEANMLHEETRPILYRDFPEWYTWQTSQQNKYWRRRERDTGVQSVRSRDTSRTVNGEILPTFREAGERRGLVEGDNTLDESLAESTLYDMPSSLRRLFATILVFCEPSDVRGLWEKHLEALSEDYRRNNPSKVAVEQMVLIDIRNMLQSMGKEIESFPLPDINEDYYTANGVQGSSSRNPPSSSTLRTQTYQTHLIRIRGMRTMKLYLLLMVMWVVCSS